MKVLLPKELRGVKCDIVLPMELNDFDIERFLPALFFLALSEGRGSVRRGKETDTVAVLIDKLVSKSSLQGFNTLEGRKLLERLVRSTLITTSSVGRSHSGEKVVSATPLTLLAFKATENQRQRGVDVFIFQSLKKLLETSKFSDEDQNEFKNLKDYIQRVFGKGVKVETHSFLDGTYDGKTELDTLTLLSIVLLDEFQKMPLGLDRQKSEESACPALNHALALDILRYLLVYHDLMPRPAFTHYLLALLNFELFTYTLKVVYAINELVRNPGVLPATMRETLTFPSPQIYVDFTGRPGSLSHEMAKRCVRRDIEEYQKFFLPNLLLRQLSGYVNSLRKELGDSRLYAEIDKTLNFSVSGPQYLQGLLLLQRHPDIGPEIRASARHDERSIRRENSHVEDGGDENALSWIDDIASDGNTPVERVVALLSESQQGKTLSKYVRWFWEVGGMTKPYGILNGTVRSRQSWVYAPSNDLLSVLVQLAAARIPPAGTLSKNAKGVRIIRLQEFLTFLEDRFGILVDRPPSQVEGAEYMAAARENLQAMLQRLRQMGIFRDLSDDFTVQRLHPPYAGAYLEEVEEA
jgi:hypothetical protein